MTKTPTEKLSEPTLLQIHAHIRLFDLERAIERESDEVSARLKPFCDAVHDSASKNLDEQGVRQLTRAESQLLGNPGTGGGKPE